MSEDPHGAFIETFGRRVRFQVIAISEIASQSLKRIEPARPLTLVDMTGLDLGRIGADARLLSDDHRIAQRWSRALWEHRARPDRLYYRARHDPSRPCAALFDRVADTVRVASQHQFGTPADDPLLVRLLDTDGFTIIGDAP